MRLQFGSRKGKKKIKKHLMQTVSLFKRVGEIREKFVNFYELTAITTKKKLRRVIM